MLATWLLPEVELPVVVEVSLLVDEVLLEPEDRAEVVAPDCAEGLVVELLEAVPPLLEAAPLVLVGVPESAACGVPDTGAPWALAIGDGDAAAAASALAGATTAVPNLIARGLSLLPLTVVATTTSDMAMTATSPTPISSGAVMSLLNL